MAKKKRDSKQAINLVAKVPTGIKGVDEITGGGLPKGRTTLLCGNAGCGKTLFASEFLINGAIEYKEPGLFISFEESESDLIKNVSSMGFDLKKLIKQKKIVVDLIHIDSREFEEIGTYNLDGLFVRLEYQIKKYGIKRIVIDTIEVLFGNLVDQVCLRSELQRLFGWFKQKGLTTIITAESGKDSFSRHGLEEYVADCVIFLDHRIEDQISTRRLRVVKYRGSIHGTNEYPFLISEKGILISPITSLSLNYQASKKRISSGIKRLDNMFDGKGFYKGSSILISGVAGTGKSSFAGSFADSVCKNSGRCIYFSFEESVSQIIRNMNSIGIDLQQWIDKNLLQIHVTRPYSHGLENHILLLHDLIDKFKPEAVIIDPITNLKAVDNSKEIKAGMVRLIDYMKNKQITAMLTNLISVNLESNMFAESMSSLMDAWIVLQNQDIDGELNRSISILKARGMNNSNQTREVVITKNGIEFKDVYIDDGKVLTGTARIAKELQDITDQQLEDNKFRIQQQKILNQCRELEAKIEVLKASLEITREEMIQTITLKNLVKDISKRRKEKISDARMADNSSKKFPGKNKEKNNDKI